MRSARKPSIVGLAALLVAVMVAPATAQEQDGPLRIALGADEGTLTPYTYVFGNPGFDILHLVYDSMFLMDADNVPQPWLVEDDYEISDDGQEMSFTVRDDITWHDGEPLTADDIAFTYGYYVDNPAGAGRFASALAGVEAVEADGDELSITLSGPDPDFTVSVLADAPIIPEHVWADLPDPEESDADVGSGPYRLTEYEPESFYRLEANEEYFAGAPTVPEIVLPVIGDNTAMFTALQVGEIDAMTENVSPELVEQFEENADIEVASGPGYATTLLQFNHEIAPFDDVAFRQAVALAIDTDALLDRVMLGYADPGSMGFFHPATPFFNPDAAGQYDPDEAAAMLDEAGYEQDGDVRTTPDGEALDHELLVYSDNPLRIRAAELIAADLAAVGIDVSVQTLDATTVDSLVWPEFDVQQGRDFEMSMWGWSASSQLGPTNIRDLFYSDLSQANLNIGAFGNEEFDELADELMLAANPDERDQIVMELQEIIAEQAPIVPLYYQQVVNAYDPEAYDGWTFQAGKGIVTKLSFIPEFAGAEPAPEEPAEEEETEESEEADEPTDEVDSDAAAEESEEDGGALTTLLIIGAVLVALIIAALVISRSRKTEGAS